MPDRGRGLGRKEVSEMTQKKFGTTLRLDQKPVRCPLCHQWMRREYIAENNIIVFACDLDRIAIAANDPLLGKWEAAYEKVPDKIICPVPSCETEMRYFATSTGYWKAKCPKPKCGATMANPIVNDGKNGPPQKKPPTPPKKGTA